MTSVNPSFIPEQPGNVRIWSDAVTAKPDIDVLVPVAQEDAQSAARATDASQVVLNRDFPEVFSLVDNLATTFLINTTNQERTESSLQEIGLKTQLYAEVVIRETFEKLGMMSQIPVKDFGVITTLTKTAIELFVTHIKAGEDAQAALDIKGLVYGIVDVLKTSPSQEMSKLLNTVQIDAFSTQLQAVVEGALARESQVLAAPAVKDPTMASTRTSQLSEALSGKVSLVDVGSQPEGVKIQQVWQAAQEDLGLATGVGISTVIWGSLVDYAGKLLEKAFNAEGGFNFNKLDELWDKLTFLSPEDRQQLKTTLLDKIEGAQPERIKDLLMSEIKTILIDPSGIKRLPVILSDTANQLKIAFSPGGVTGTDQLDTMIKSKVLTGLNSEVEKQWFLFNAKNHLKTNLRTVVNGSNPLRMSTCMLKSLNEILSLSRKSDSTFKTSDGREVDLQDKEAIQTYRADAMHKIARNAGKLLAKKNEKTGELQIGTFSIARIVKFLTPLLIKLKIISIKPKMGNLAEDVHKIVKTSSAGIDHFIAKLVENSASSFFGADALRDMIKMCLESQKQNPALQEILTAFTSEAQLSRFMHENMEVFSVFILEAFSSECVAICEGKSVPSEKATETLTTELTKTLKLATSAVLEGEKIKNTASQSLDKALEAAVAVINPPMVVKEVAKAWKSWID